MRRNIIHQAAAGTTLIQAVPRCCTTRTSTALPRMSFGGSHPSPRTRGLARFHARAAHKPTDASAPCREGPSRYSRLRRRWPIGDGRLDRPDRRLVQIPDVRARGVCTSRPTLVAVAAHALHVPGGALHRIETAPCSMTHSRAMPPWCPNIPVRAHKGWCPNGGTTVGLPSMGAHGLSAPPMRTQSWRLQLTLPFVLEHRDAAWMLGAGWTGEYYVG